MALYPIFLETKGRRVIVIGGGHVGAEKVRGLLNGEADITVVSPDLIPELREQLDAGRIKLSDYRGETVVLAFFFEARTKG